MYTIHRPPNKTPVKLRHLSQMYVKRRSSANKSRPAPYITATCACAECARRDATLTGATCAVMKSIAVTRARRGTTRHHAASRGNTRPAGVWAQPPCRQTDTHCCNDILNSCVVCREHQR
ncbi:unnamed protein product [Chrysodeixis includens]|uniref:Uncharacterized protein n=1 Tax=Chrysodeixis includens TaxID=689277 RepID=A0A9P0BXS9_CHRIL|nr:unnamed protein product [Chrysodeixis includens]